MQTKVNVRKVLLYVGLVWLLSFAGLRAYLALGGTWSILPASLYMFMPLAVTLLVQVAIYRESALVPFWVNIRLNRWFLLAAIIPVALLLLSIGFSTLIPGTILSYSTDDILRRSADLYSPEELVLMRQQMEALPVHPFWTSLVGGILAGFSINALFAFGEEFGWRGFMLKELMPMGFWKCSAITGVVWGIWHAPAILQGHNYPENPAAGVFMMVLLSVLMSPVLSYVCLKANSVVAAAAMHGVINGVAGIPIMVLEGGSRFTTGMTGLAGMLALLLVNLAIARFGGVPNLERKFFNT